MSVGSYTSITKSIFDYSSITIKEITPTEHVKHFVIKFFGVIRQGAVTVLGVNDFAMQGFYYNRRLLNAPHPRNANIDRRIRENYKYRIRGGLQIVSGFIGIMVAYQHLQYQIISKGYQILNKIGNGCFIGAHMTSFQQNYSLFKKSQFTLRHSLDPQEIAQAYCERKAAYIGMFSSFCYIVSAILGMFETAEIWLVLAIIFGCVAPATSVIQLLYEVYYQVGDFASVI